MIIKQPIDTKRTSLITLVVALVMIIVPAVLPQQAAAQGHQVTDLLGSSERVEASYPEARLRTVELCPQPTGF